MSRTTNRPRGLALGLACACLLAMVLHQGIARSGPEPRPRARPANTKAARAGASSYDETYRIEDRANYCDSIPRFNARGPDEQVIASQTWDFHPGFKCPGSCWNHEPVTISGGVLRFTLLYVDDKPELANAGYQISIRRTRYELRLKPRGDHVDGSGDYAFALGAFLKQDVPPYKWSHNNYPSETSDQLRIRARFGPVNEPVVQFSGRGRIGEVIVETGHADKFDRLDGDGNNATCSFVAFGSDFRRVAESGDYSTPTLFKMPCETDQHDDSCRHD